MKLVTCEYDGETVHGVLDGEHIEVLGPGDLSALVVGSDPEPSGMRLRREEVRILAPLQAPGKILAVAANYQEHVTESGREERDVDTASPRLFLKPDTSIVGDNAEVELAPITTQFDWEAELAVVIGRTARNVSVADALDYVFGYATSNDLSARNLVLGMPRDGEAWTSFFDWLEGKWLDGSAPIGPYLVTADDVPDPQNLAIRLSVNGVVKQEGSTAGMIHTVAELVSFSSRLMTLRPGDVILTGTPAGVGATTGSFLAPGDVVVTEIETLGALTTRIVAPRPNGR
ncbi:fumarylacetoacetate hydrolase family protein [Microbacterium arabinogalactanolyticum]|uniref:fumarylacetoacetate hydrolase family protein n=1 Tax=Microbacterium arabinogalactanolyticum TaxID=69365 RepID=UPI0040444AB6